MKSNWRDSFLIERGKMTTDRYNKIRNSLPPVSYIMFQEITPNDIIIPETTISIGIETKYGLCILSVK